MPSFYCIPPDSLDKADVSGGGHFARRPGFSMPDSSPLDRRRAHRFEAQLSAKLHVASWDDAVPVRLLDLSIGGAMIRSSRDLEVGADCVLEILCAHVIQGPDRYRFSAQCQRCSRGELALNFDRESVGDAAYLISQLVDTGVIDETGS